MHRMELHGDEKVLFLTCLFVIFHSMFLLLLLLFFSFFFFSSSLLLLFLKLFDKFNVYSCAHVSYFKWFPPYRNVLFSLLFLSSFETLQIEITITFQKILDSFLKILPIELHTYPYKMTTNIRHKRKLSLLDNSNQTTNHHHHHPGSTLTKRFRGIAYDG